MLVIVALLIGLIIVFLFRPNYVAIIRFLLGIALYMLCGGNSMLIILFQNIIYSKQSRMVLSDDAVMNMIESNNQVLELFREYCENEFSLENVTLALDLVDFKKKGFASLEEMQAIEKLYLLSLSKYEVNISSPVRKNILEKIRSMEQSAGSTIPFSDLAYLYLEIISNLKSSYSRFQKTSIYTEWEEVHKLQKEQAII